MAGGLGLTFKSHYHTQQSNERASVAVDAHPVPYGRKECLVSYCTNEQHILILNPYKKPQKNPTVKGTSAIAQDGDMSRRVIKIDCYFF